MNSLFLILLLAIMPAAHYRHHGNVLLPDPAVTPGMVNPETSAMNPQTGLPHICDTDFRTGPYRKTTPKMKRDVCAEYGYSAQDCPGPTIEIDHLLPLENGGADDERNLWVQPYAGIGAHVKDKLENAAHRLVCTEKSITVEDFQKCVVDDWYACGLKLKVFDESGNLLGSPHRH